MSTSLRILALALLAALPTACAARADASTREPATTPPPDAVKVSIDAARATALKAVPGQIKEEELEQERGRWLYSFEIVPTHPATAGQIMEVNIDAGDGSVLEVVDESSEKDDDRDDDHDDRD